MLHGTLWICRQQERSGWRQEQLRKFAEKLGMATWYEHIGLSVDLGLKGDISQIRRVLDKIVHYHHFEHYSIFLDIGPVEGKSVRAETAGDDAAEAAGEAEQVERAAWEELVAAFGDVLTDQPYWQDQHPR